MVLLEIKQVEKTYRTKLGFQQCVALRGISCKVEEGEFVAIMGASGSGKTTLLNILASLDRPSAGEVLLDGIKLSDIPDRELSRFRRDKLGFVFQDFNLLDSFSLRDNILLPLVLARRPLAEMEQRLIPVADMLGITTLLAKFPYEVSGGEKQRTAVARAVITEPRLLLADEPTGALDSRASANLLQVFTKLNCLGRTILMVTHSAQAASYARRVLFISDGRLVSQLFRAADENDHSFFARIISSQSALAGGGEQNG